MKATLFILLVWNTVLLVWSISVGNALVSAIGGAAVTAVGFALLEVYTR